MKSTFITQTGARIVVEPSPMFGNIRVSIRGTEQIVAIPLELALIVAQAIEAAAIELAGPEMQANIIGQGMANKAAVAAARQFGSRLSDLPHHPV